MEAQRACSELLGMVSGKRLGRFCVVLVGIVALCTHLAAAVDYDIVYVRWPRKGSDVTVDLPQAEDPYIAEPGADLVLLHPDGTQDVLVDCETCCVQDPMVSFDGKWVYYTKMEDASRRTSPSLLYKMHLGTFEEVQLTFDDGALPPSLAAEFGVRDMGPCPLPGGGVAFTSNRHATIAPRQGTWRSVSTASRSTAMDLYVLEPANSEVLTSGNLVVRRIGYASLHMALHPIMLTDGRILFSQWDDAGGKFSYGMTTLYSIRPDGSGLRQVTEPHDHHKRVDHFATQLSGGEVVVCQYYPGRDFGYGILAVFSSDRRWIEFQKEPSSQLAPVDGAPFSFRSFERLDWRVITTHTWARDCPAPNDSGKYSMPAAAPGGHLLVAYSLGGVNTFSGCDGDDNLYSGIYLIENAAEVADPGNLVTILNTPDHNEIWPRAVVPYREIYGIDEPARTSAGMDGRIEPGRQVAVVGTSSLYNRESEPRGGDPFYNSSTRENHSGSWRIQGADAGVVRNSEIYGVRIITSAEKPWRRPISRHDPETAGAHAEVRDLLYDRRYDSFVEGFTSVHAERWTVLGEFPVRKPGVLDSRGDPDTSFEAFIPANTPYFYQGIDENGLTLFSELTWRSTIPGENRTNCGGCHAHTIAPVPFEGTAAGRGEVPAFDATGEPWGVEYHRDVLPILLSRCAACHTGTNSLVLDDDPYFRLVLDSEAQYGPPPPGGRSLYAYPQLTRYIRALQARQSLLVWALFGRRLDGRSDDDRNDDLDYVPCKGPHGATSDEVQTIARWIDLGCPRDFTGPEHEGYRYTDVAPMRAPLPPDNLVGDAE